MPYIPDILRTEAFIAGNKDLYNELLTNPQLRMVPIDRLHAVRSGLYKLGYLFRIRYRGPHRPKHDTLKHDARSFTVYINNAEY